MAKINFSQMEFCSQHQTQHAESFSTEKLLKKPTKETYSLQIWHETAKTDARWLGAHTLMGSMSTELRSQHLSQRLSISAVSRILLFMVLVILSCNFFTMFRIVKKSIVVKVMKFSSQHQTQHAESFSSKTNNRNVRYPDLMWDCQKWCQMVRSTHNDGQQVHRTYISALVSASQQFP